MNPELWSRIEELFEEAAELPPGSVPAFLDAHADSNAVRREVESLLAADAKTDHFMREPAIPSRLSDLLEKAGAPRVEGHIGHYRLLRQLGEGGMSRVYLAVRDDDEFQKLVAIKVIREGLDGKDVMHRFRTERQILASLEHPNIARLLDGGSTEEGRPYFVMEFIEGEPIDAYCDNARLSVRQRIGLFLKVCSAVSYAHRNLIVHRDLKATNILVTRDSEPKLLDFGIAKLLKPEQFTLPLDLTAPNVRPLTPFYASPEQIQGGLITTATDVYSLGVLLFKLVTGHFPYRLKTQTLQEVEKVVLEGEPEAPSTALSRIEETDGEDCKETTSVVTPEIISRKRSTPFSRLRRQLAGDLDNILLMALRKEPQRRYPSVLQFAQDLERFLSGEPVLAHKDTLAYRAAKFLRRHRIPATAAAAFVLLLVSFSVVVSMQASRAAAQRDQAELERDRAENVVRFLQGIFQLSDPKVGGGAERITAREILNRGAERVERELAGQPEVQATLMEAIGNVYRNLGLFDSAEPLLRQALSLRENLLGTEHPAVAQSLNNLAIVLRSRGDFTGAEPLFRRALAMRQARLPTRDPEVAQSLYNLGRLLRETGRFEEAVPLYTEAISIFRQEASENRIDLTAALIDLAILRTNVGDFLGAEPLFREALDLRRDVYPANHALVAEAANDLGVLLGMQQNLEEAEPLFREALEIRQRTLGADHPDVAESLNNLARLLRERGDLDNAEALYRQGIDSIRRVQGRDHPLVATLTSNLASLLQLRGDYPAAEIYHREALEIRRRILGDRHQDLAVSLKNLGTVLLARNRAGEAEEHLRQAVAIFGEVLPANHWRTAEAVSLLGECLAALGQNEQATTHLIEGFEALKLSLGIDHRRSQEALGRLVSGLQTIGGEPERLSRYQSLMADSP